MMSDGPACCSHFSALTMALVSACTVRGLAFTKSSEAYRQPAGIGPPNSCSVPARVRVLATIFASPFCSSMVITGSTLDSASMRPERSAASAALPVPTPMIATSVGFRPFFARK